MFQKSFTGVSGPLQCGSTLYCLLRSDEIVQGEKKLWEENDNLVKHLSDFGIRLLPDERLLRGFDPLWDHPADPSGFQSGFLLSDTRLLLLSGNSSSRTSKSSLLAAIWGVELIHRPRPVWALLTGLVFIVVALFIFLGQNVRFGDISDDPFTTTNVTSTIFLMAGVAVLIYYYRLGQTALTFSVGNSELSVSVDSDRLENATEFIEVFYITKLALERKLNIERQEIKNS